jgi:hypothetical protein
LQSYFYNFFLEKFINHFLFYTHEVLNFYRSRAL